MKLDEWFDHWTFPTTIIGTSMAVIIIMVVTTT